MDKAGVSTRKSDSKEWKIYRKVEEKKKGKIFRQRGDIYLITESFGSFKFSVHE